MEKTDMKKQTTKLDKTDDITTSKVEGLDEVYKSIICIFLHQILNLLLNVDMAQMAIRC